MKVETLRRVALAAVGHEGDKPLDRLIDELVGLEGHADELLCDEAGADDLRADVALPQVTIADAEGRPITGVRLDREPGTDRFTIVLLVDAPVDQSQAAA